MNINRTNFYKKNNLGLNFNQRIVKSFSAVLGSALISSGAVASDVDNANKPRRTLDEIVVTAQKKTSAENVQDIPIAISAFGSDQLEKMNLQDLTDIGARVPNAIIENMGTAKGLAGFSIRGQQSFSSIASLEPKVSAFVDGMYYGINQGVLFDTFDLESIEILRGPQGILFGRNSVGGAVRVRTKSPTDVLSAEVMTSVESGFRGTGESYTTTGIISGPLLENLNGKLAIYRNDDRGWFENEFDGDDFGKSTTTVIRGALDYQPTDNLQFLLKLESGDQEGQGQAAQSHTNRAGIEGLFSRNSHDISLDNPGIQENTWNQAILETNIDVEFGNGRITNILGWREYDQEFCMDIDGSPNDRFNAACLQDPVGSAPQTTGNGLEQEQISNEIRYSGTFADYLDLTIGISYFEQELTTNELRSIFGGVSRQSGGGFQDHKALGIFANGDFNVSDKLTISAGFRYSEEEKDVKTTALRAPKPDAAITGFCKVTLGACPFDFVDDNNWSNVDYKMGASYKWSETNMVYASFATGFRAGGYNLRNSRVTDRPGPIEEEFVDSYEIGIKSEPNDRLRINASIFYSTTEDAQRAIITVGEFGPVQTITNVAEVEIYGFEVESQFLLTDNITLNLTAGFLNAEYDKISEDLTGDGVVNSEDYDLDLPNVVDENYSFSINHDLELDELGSISSLLSYTYRGYRDLATDNLGGFSESVGLLGFNISWIPLNSKFEVSLYGKNMLDEVNFLSDLQLPSSIGSTFSVLDKGRVIGLRAKYVY